MIYKTLLGTSYIDEYLKLVYDTYILTQPSILATYYNFDEKNSVYDQSNLSTYSTPGDSNLSGIAYTKIHNLPLLFGIRTSRQEVDSQQKAVNEYDTTFQIFLPTIYNIMPFRYDLIAFRPSPKGDTLVFTVSTIEESTVSNNPIYFGYYLTLKPTYLKESDIKVSEEKAFDPILNKIVDIDTSNKHTIELALLDKISKKLYNCYNSCIFAYVDEIGQRYTKDFESIITNFLQKYMNVFKQLVIPYSSYINVDWLNNQWKSFLNTGDPTMLGLSKDTVINESILQWDSPQLVDSVSLLDSFILLHKIKHWFDMEGLINEVN